MLGTSQQNAIQDSIEKLTCSTRVLAEDFYAHLFLSAPKLREMFPRQMSQQVVKLEQTLVYVLGAMDDTETLSPVLAELGLAHHELGATPAHYTLVKRALIAALSVRVRDWSPEHQAAWSALYDFVADRMLEGARAYG